MGTDGKPFDALGRILSEGGDRALANAMARGNLKHEALLLAKWRGWGASDSDIATVRGIADKAVNAGRELTLLDPFQPINFSIVPVNPLLFGPDQAGLRFYVSTDYQLSDSGLWYRADFTFSDLYSTSDIIGPMSDEAIRRARTSPERFGISQEVAGNTFPYVIQTIIGSF